MSSPDTNNPFAANYVLRHLSKGLNKVEKDDDDTDKRKFRDRRKNESKKVKKPEIEHHDFTDELKNLEFELEESMKKNMTKEEKIMTKILEKLEAVERKVNITKTEMKLMKQEESVRIAKLQEKIVSITTKLDVEISRKMKREKKMQQLEEKIKKSVDDNYLKIVSVEEEIKRFENKFAEIKAKDPKSPELKIIATKIKQTKAKLKEKRTDKEFFVDLE